MIQDLINPPGECYKVEVTAAASRNTQSSHGLGLFEALELAKAGGILVADRVSVYAVTARNLYEFSEHIDARIIERIPLIVDEIRSNEFPEGMVKDARVGGCQRDNN